MGGRSRVWLTTVVTVGVLFGLDGLLLSAARSRVREVLAPGPASLDEVVGALAAAGALVLGGWLLLSGTAAVLAHAPGRLGQRADRIATSWAPLLTRRLAAVLVGATVGGALGPATAMAQESPPFPGFSVSTRTSARTPEAPAPGWVPTRPVHRPVVTPGLVTSGATSGGTSGVMSGGAPTDHAEVVVHREDTLWSLAADHLGPGATDAEVAEAWPRWHQLNRAVIGDDPDRLLPGQVLRVPLQASGTAVER